MKRLILMPGFLLLYFLFFGIQYSYGQAVEENQEVRSYLDNMFETLDKSKIPHGLLRDYAFELVDMDRFDGSGLNATNSVDRQTYEMLLRTIRSSAVTTAKPFEDVGNILVKQYNAGSSSTLILSAMTYQYSVIKASALTDNLIQYKNKKVSDNYKNGIWQNPYETRYVIGFCGQDSIFTTSSITFKLDASSWFSNLSYTKIEINTGSGYKSIEVGGSITENYATDGIKDIKLRITLTTGKQLLSHTSIETLGHAATRSTYEDDFLYTPKRTITGEPYKGLSTSAEVFVAYAPSNNTGRIKKPFIVVEGFDPRFNKKATFDEKQKDRGVSTMATFYKNLKKDQFFCYDLFNNYDIVYVDWVDSEEFIQANANTLKKVIQWVNGQKNDLNSSTPNVIMGQSMGGIIARYALRSMENEGLKHGVSLYISDDAPHLGANIPLGALYELYGICSFLENKKVIGSFLNKYADSGTLLSGIEKIAHSHAAKQMLVNYVDYSGNLNNTEHNLWQEELAELGFPRGDNGNIRMLGIANGSYFANTVPTSYLKVDFSASSDLIGLVPFYSWLSSPLVGWGLNDLWAGLLNLVPGKTTIRGLFEINPGISFGAKIAEVTLKYIKKYLWLVNVSRTVFSYQANMNNSLLYDTYPSSYYNLEPYRSSIVGENGGGIPIVGKYNYSASMWNSIPFVPTSSALCVGYGKQNLTSNMFFTAPDISNTPFGANIYRYKNLSSEHIELENVVWEWINTQLDFGIIGPKQGVNGSKYSVQNPNAYTIQWSTDSPNIATIDQNGVLHVVGNGIIHITAKGGTSIESSMEVMVGTPKFVLEDAVRKPGFYEIKSKCINTQYADFLSKYSNVLSYKWGVKTNDQPLVWLVSESPELRVSTLEDNDNTTVYLKIIDEEGNESDPLFIRISGQDIYDLGYKTLVFNKDGNLYTDKGLELFYDYVTMPLNYRDETYDEFSNAEWSPVSAIVINDENTSRGIPWKRKGYIRDIIPASEKERILLSTDGKIMIFKLMLLNFDGEIVQQTPFTVMYKTNYPNN